jgi:hypothetical protein
MASQNFDIASLFERAFGYKQGLPFDSSKIVPPQYLEATPYENVPQTDETEFSKFRQMRLQLGGNVLGQPLFMPVGFDVDGELVLLPNEPTLQVSVKKIVVKTQLVGSKRDGTVKELISLDDYEIVLRGIAISTTSKKVFPEDDIFKIHELFLKNKSVSIISGLTALLGINKVVIESFDLPTMIGIQHAQAYELKMVSDADWFLELD